MMGTSKAKENGTIGSDFVFCFELRRAFVLAIPGRSRGLRVEIQGAVYAESSEMLPRLVAGSPEKQERESDSGPSTRGVPEPTYTTRQSVRVMTRRLDRLRQRIR
jgi:hypothetical protein